MCVHNRIRNAPARSGTRTISVSCASSFLHYMHLNLFLVIFLFQFWKRSSFLPTITLRWLIFCSDKFACLLSSRRPLYFSQVFFIVSDQVLKWRKVVFFWLIVLHLHIIPVNSSFKCNCIYHSLVLFFLSFDKASIYCAFCSVANSHVMFCCSSLSLSLVWQQVTARACLTRSFWAVILGKVWKDLCSSSQHGMQNNPDMANKL